MNIIEAIQRANAFVLQANGVVGSPDFAQLVKKPSSPSTWLISYSGELFFSDWLDQGDIIDGGEYVVVVNNDSGAVKLLNEM